MIETKKINRRLFSILLLISLGITSCSRITRRSVWLLTKRIFVEIIKEIPIIIITECTFNDCIPNDEKEYPNQNIQSLEEFFKIHYILLEQKKYELAWNNFSSSFKANQEEKGGYLSYYSWWSSIDLVSVIDFQINQESIGNTVISIGSIYQKKVTANADIYYGNQSSLDFIQSVQFSFVWDVNRKSWTIDGIDILEERPVP